MHPQGRRNRIHFSPNRRASLRVAAACVAAAAVLGVAGCGDDDSAGKPAAATALTITRDFGATTLYSQKDLPVTDGLTAMRQLQANAKIETTYGGRFVSEVNGVKSDAGEGTDWLFYVDGTESATGAAAWRIKPGQVVQWDFHHWRDITAPKAIVGAFPRPLSTRGVNLQCRPEKSQACVAVADQLRAAGAPLSDKPDAVKMVVGTWADIAKLEGVPNLTKAPADNGAFAAFTGSGDFVKLQLLGGDGKVVETHGSGTGLVTATREGGKDTWVVTGVDQQGLVQAVRALNADALKNRFAVAARSQGMIPLPVSHPASHSAAQESSK